MNVERLNIVRFGPKGDDSFYDAVVKRVKDYFIGNNISPYANREMWVKTIIMILLYFVPYSLIVAGVGSGSLWFFLGLWFLMGLGKTGIGTSVMHDANHGAYSASKKLNNSISHILEVIGGYTVTWRIQHNLLHHTYTNLEGLDEDIDTMGILRLSPNQPRRWYHRYQHYYAWFFYMIMTLYWMTGKDYMSLFRYAKKGLLIKQNVSLYRGILRMSFYKLCYYGYILVLPILFSGMEWYYVLTGFLLMHFTAGLCLSAIFQPAHIMETSAFKMAIEEGNKKRMEDSWAAHEVVNTTNFAPRSKILSWFIGGLNYQIEHHLFTGICHVHYKKIASIVQSTMAEYGLPYHVQPTFFKALAAHVKMLRKLAVCPARGFNL